MSTLATSYNKRKPEMHVISKKYFTLH